MGPCRAHRQRRPWALEHLHAARAACGRPLRVLSYACGPEHTLRTWTTTAPDTTVHLYDTEPRALQWCDDRFRDQGTGVHTHTLNPNELVDGSADVSAAAPADVALVLGLFDYLTPEAIGALVDRLVGVLAPGGRLLCTNGHVTNPWRVFMEYLGAWQVQHRGLDELAAMVVRGRSDLQVIDARLDDSGTNAYVAIQRRVAL
ncbi:MAG: class I SAM-dependent methyltransferase [Pseudomonadota bacterium]|nr:class I SAM-dependent methyltransferase [Pseudomonadota bacterium]